MRLKIWDISERQFVKSQITVELLKSKVDFKKKDTEKKEINSLDTLNFEYGFDTLKQNMKLWQKKAMFEMRNSK